MATEAPNGLFGLMTNRMQWLTERQRVLAENVANASTPNYRPHDLVEPDFKSTLQQAMMAPTPTITNANHIQAGVRSMPGIVEKEAPVVDVKPSGNAVSLETEMAKISSTSVDYQTMTALFKKWHGLLRLALGRVA